MKSWWEHELRYQEVTRGHRKEFKLFEGFLWNVGNSGAAWLPGSFSKWDDQNRNLFKWFGGWTCRNTGKVRNHNFKSFSVIKGCGFYFEVSLPVEMLGFLWAEAEMLELISIQRWRLRGSSCTDKLTARQRHTEDTATHVTRCHTLSHTQEPKYNTRRKWGDHLDRD